MSSKFLNSIKYLLSEHDNIIDHNNDFISLKEYTKNLYQRSFFNEQNSANLLQKSIEIHSSDMKFLKKYCNPENQRMKRAAIHSRLDGRSRGYIPEKRHCLRHTWKIKNGDSKMIKRIIPIIQRILINNISMLTPDVDIIMKESHFDVISYRGIGSKFTPHRDSVKDMSGYIQYSMILCIHSEDLSNDSIIDGCTTIYHDGSRHIFKETITPGMAIIFRSDFLHASERISIPSGRKDILKFDFYISTSWHYNHLIKEDCTCIMCDKESGYKKRINAYLVFFGKHKKIKSLDILLTIFSFTRINSCSCPYKYLDYIYCYCDCKCKCSNCVYCSQCEGEEDSWSDHEDDYRSFGTCNESTN